MKSKSLRTALGLLILAVLIAALYAMLVPNEVWRILP